MPVPQEDIKDACSTRRYQGCLFHKKISSLLWGERPARARSLKPDRQWCNISVIQLYRSPNQKDLAGIHKFFTCVLTN
ncbi:MAG: hypothetical protein ICV80_06235 [Microcoleus sp. T1-bin1]|nr:hypothetical protein [Microcoleus sp. T1-bin1]